MNKNVSSDNIELAKYITTIVGTNRSVQRYWDDDKLNHLDIFKCDDPLDSSVQFYGTIGLSDYSNEVEMKDSALKNIPIEFLFSSYSRFKEAPNIIATCGFYVIKNKWNCQYGSVFKSIVNMYYDDVTMQHILFVSPFLWQNKLQPLSLENKTVNWLLAIPISNAELTYKNENGTSSLENLFEEKSVDIFDLDRKSVV